MYRIHLQDFEGPLDLLLHFIRRDELDVFDIPIAEIADEYLAYVRVLEEIDLDSAGDFLYMAALLISIKARMLLPNPEVDEEGEPVDPRQELVERLLEYVRFKEASQQLGLLHDRRDDRFTRGRASRGERDEDEPSEVPIDASVFDLIAALRRVLTEAPPEPTHAVVREAFSVEEQQVYVRVRLEGRERVSFVELVREQRKSFIIATFLAVLELARLGEIELFVPAVATDFFLERRVAVPSLNGNGKPGDGRRQRGALS